MTLLEDGVAEGFIIKNINTSLVGKDASFDLPVGQARVEREGNVLVHRLDGMEDKGAASGGRLNAMGEGHVDYIDEEGWEKEGDSIIVVICMRKKVWTSGEGIFVNDESGKSESR